MVEKYTVSAPFDGSAADVLRALGFSRTIITALRKQEGLIKVVRNGETGDGNAVFATARVNKGDTLLLALPVTPVLYPSSDVMPDFRYLDDDIAVIDKPSGIATVPVRSHYKDSLAGALANVWGEFVYRPVGRLDKDTSGLLIVARNALSACRMHEIQLAGKIEKTYTALVSGIIPESGEIDVPIALSDDGLHREASENGKPAKTLYRRLAICGRNSLAEFRLLTGRTHQIRVHSAYIGHPILGDSLYNPEPKEAERLMLHCSKLVFPHPSGGKTVTVTDDFTAHCR